MAAILKELRIGTFATGSAKVADLRGKAARMAASVADSAEGSPS